MPSTRRYMKYMKLKYKVYLQAASDIAMTELPPTHPIRWELILWLSEEKTEFSFAEELLKVMELPQGFLPQTEIKLFIQDNDAVLGSSISMLKAKYCSALEGGLKARLRVVESLAALQYLSSKKSRSTGHSRPSLPTCQLHQPSELQTLIHKMNSTLLKPGIFFWNFCLVSVSKLFMVPKHAHVFHERKKMR